MKPRAFTLRDRQTLRAWWPVRYPDGSPVWRVSELCLLFGCSSKTLCRWCKILGLAQRKPQRRRWEVR